MLATWKVTGNPSGWKEFQVVQPCLYPSQEDRVRLQVTTRLGIMDYNQFHNILRLFPFTTS